MLVRAVNSQVEGEAREGWGINLAMKRHLDLEITSFQENSKRRRRSRAEYTYAYKTLKFHTRMCLCAPPLL